MMDMTTVITTTTTNDDVALSLTQLLLILILLLIPLISLFMSQSTRQRQRGRQKEVVKEQLTLCQIVALMISIFFRIIFVILCYIVKYCLSSRIITTNNMVQIKVDWKRIVSFHSTSTSSSDCSSKQKEDKERREEPFLQIRFVHPCINSNNEKDEGKESFHLPQLSSFCLCIHTMGIGSFSTEYNYHGCNRSNTDVNTGEGSSNKASPIISIICRHLKVHMTITKEEEKGASNNYSKSLDMQFCIQETTTSLSPFPLWNIIHKTSSWFYKILQEKERKRLSSLSSFKMFFLKNIFHSIVIKDISISITENNLFQRDHNDLSPLLSSSFHNLCISCDQIKAVVNHKEVNDEGSKQSLSSLILETALENIRFQVHSSTTAANIIRCTYCTSSTCINTTIYSTTTTNAHNDIQMEGNCIAIMVNEEDSNDTVPTDNEYFTNIIYFLAVDHINVSISEKTTGLISSATINNINIYEKEILHVQEEEQDHFFTTTSRSDTLFLSLVQNEMSNYTQPSFSSSLFATKMTSSNNNNFPIVKFNGIINVELEKTIEEERDSSSSTNISLNIYTVSNTNNRSGDSSSGIDIHWSPMLHIELLRIISFIQQDIQHSLTTVRTSFTATSLTQKKNQQKHSKKNIISTINLFNGDNNKNNLNVTVWGVEAGGGKGDQEISNSLMNITCTSIHCILNIEKIQEKGEKKPRINKSIQLKCNRVKIKLLNEELDIFCIRNIFFSFKTITTTTTTSSNSVRAELSKEEFVVLNVEKIIFRLPHKLHFGQVQKDILMIPKVIKQQQSALLLQQQKHQLQSSKAAVTGITMNIRSCISQVDIAFLPPLPRSPLQHHLTSNTATDQFLFRTLLHKTKVEIQRDNDSNGNNNTVQRHLQTLDGNSSSSLSENNGDDSNNVLYCGVQGGYVKLKISRAVILLDCPSTANNILTPLTVIDRGLGWNGYFFLAQAQAQKKRNDSDNNQTQQRTMNYTSVILSRSFQRRRRRTRKVQKVNIYSHGIPMKVYMDGNLLLNKISTSLGKSILKISIPMLNEAIKRMLPPATPHAQKEENKPSSSPPSGLSWWDNIRYMIHGKIRIQAKSFSFRWLLEDDSILCNNTYEWSLLTNIDKLDLKYSLGRVKVKIEYLHLSLPGQAYKRGVKTNNATKTSSVTAEEAKDSHNDDNNNRQSLLLIPNLELLLDFQWHLLNPQTLITPQSHHVPYLNYDDSTTLAMKQNLEKDKFFYFRSCGIHIQGNLKLMTTTSPHKSNIMKNKNKETGVAYYANWIALRMDTLPWLTHQQKKQQPCLNKKKDPQEESNTRPKPTIATTSTNDPSNSDSTSKPQQQQQQQQNFPIIESLSVSLSANDIQMALWHGSLLKKNENDRRKIPSTSSNKENNYSSDRGLLFKIGNLLVNYEAALSSSSSLSDDDSRIMGRCARKLVPKSTRIEMLGHFHVTLLDLMKKRKQSSPLNNSAVGTIEVPSSSSSSMVRITRTETQHAMANKFDQLSQFCNLLGKDEEYCQAFSNDKNVSSPPPPRKSYSLSSGTIFDILQKWSSETISASDYIVEADNIVIMDTQISDDYLPPSSLRHFQSKREDSSSYQHTSNLLRPSLYDFRKNHLMLNPTTANHHYNIIDNNKSEKDKKKKPSKHTASVASKVEERHTSCDAGKNKKTWTVLVSCMKLLWTLEIRDVLYKLIGDQLLETINFMVVQLKEDGSNPGDDSMEEEEEDAGYSDKKATSSTVTKTSFHIPDPNKEQLNEEEEEETTPTTNLMYLLRRTGSGVSYASDDDFRSIRQNSTMTKPSPTSDHKQKRKTKSIIDKDSTFYDIVDIHLYNPQIQLHSESTTTTGGSILLAMKGVYIKGKSYSKLFMIDSSSDSSFLRQSEFQYVLQSVQGFASPGGIDLSSGLQWLNLVSIAKEEEKEESKESEKGDSSFFTNKDNFILGNQQTLGSLRDLIPSSNSPIEELLSPLKKCKGRNNKEDPPYYRPFLHHHHHHQEKERSMKDYFKEFSKEKVFETTHLFRKILDPFNFRTIQVFQRPATDLTEKELLYVVQSNNYIRLDSREGAPTDYLELQIDELSFELDKYQFSTTMDLIRNVLLAPLPLDSVVSSPQSHTTKNNSDDDSLPSPKNNTFDKDNEQKNTKVFDEQEVEWMKFISELFRGEEYDKDKKIRNNLRNVVGQLATHLIENNIHDHIIRCIRWNLCKGKWKIRDEEFLVDDVEICFTELHGQHEFSSLGKVKSMIELEDLAVKNHKPSPESIDFFDPTAVVTTTLGERSPCLRCGALFFQSQNSIRACNTHADEFGRPGSFCNEKKIWSCCHQTWEGAPGCSFRPHTGRERAVIVSMEALPPRVPKVSLYKHLEINIYPSVNHKLNIQATKSLVNLFVAYFVGSLKDTNKEENSDKHHTNNEELCESPQGRKKSMLFGSNQTKIKPKTKKKSTQLLLNKEGPMQQEQQKQSESSSEFGLSSSSSTPRKEIFFIQHWRLGKMNFEVSLAGFPILRDTQLANNLSLNLPAFERSYKIGSGPYLSQKYFKHLKNEVIKSVTSHISLKKIYHNNNNNPDASSHFQNLVSISYDGDHVSSKEQDKQKREQIDDEKKKMLFKTPPVKHKKRKKLLFGSASAKY